MAEKDYRAENADLRRRLEEAEDTLRAIRTGAVDAFVIDQGDDLRIYTLESADRPYRLLVEQMGQGAATLDASGTIAYCNRRLAEMLDRPHGQLTGSSFRDAVAAEDQPLFDLLLEQGRRGGRPEGRPLRQGRRHPGAGLPDGQRSAARMRRGRGRPGHRPDDAAAPRTAQRRPGGAQGGRPPQERVPGHAGPRAAQPARADPQRPGGAAAGGRRRRGVGDDAAPGRPDGAPDRRPARRQPRQPGQDRAAARRAWSWPRRCARPWRPSRPEYDRMGHRAVGGPARRCRSGWTATRPGWPRWWATS